MAGCTTAMALAMVSYLPAIQIQLKSESLRYMLNFMCILD